MQDAIIYLEPASGLSLQHQIRQKIVEGILSGAFPPGMKLPSSRRLAEQLDVARNTAVLAYQQLIAEGYLVSRQRSGVFVSEEIGSSRVGSGGQRDDASEASAVRWRPRFRWRDTAEPLVRDISDWKRYPYPFIDGKYDTSLFPLNEWREASRLALNVADAEEWSTGSGDLDDPMLIEQIRTKILTRRGINAGPQEILITLGTQNGLALIARLLADAKTSVAIENPGNPDMRGLLRQQSAELIPQPVDAEGLVVDERLGSADLVYVTPSHQIPTAVAMSEARRRELLDAAEQHDFVIVEDDYECETSYEDRPLPALYSMDRSHRVVYVASLSKVFAPATRLGFIVADREFIERARQLRRMLLNHPPLGVQRAVAYFLSLGHYDALMLQLGKQLRQRRLELREALNSSRGVPIDISPPVGGTTWWVRTPDDFDVDRLAQEALREGILIEPVREFYADGADAENCFRMGVTSLPLEKIRPGVDKLVEVIRRIVRQQVEHLETSTGDWLTGDELEAAMAGATMQVPEVYGVPCIIELHADGTMSGQIGFNGDDRDTGHWRVDGDRWFRQWSRWNYAEERGYYIVIDGDTIKFFNADRQIVDSGSVELSR